MFMRVDSRTRAESVTSNYDIVLPEEVKNEENNAQNINIILALTSLFINAFLIFVAESPSNIFARSK